MKNKRRDNLARLLFPFSGQDFRKSGKIKTGFKENLSKVEVVFNK